MTQQLPDYSQIRFDLDAAKAQFAQDFPDLADRVIILDTRKKAQSGAAALKEVRALLSKAVKPKHPLLRRLTPLNKHQINQLYGALIADAGGQASMRPVRKSYSTTWHAALIVPRLSFSDHPEIELKSDHYLALFGAVLPKIFRLGAETCEAFPPPLYEHFVFDHEIAHALFWLKHKGKYHIRKKWNQDVDQFEESFCDAYATLRHLQRHGTDDFFPQVMALARTAGAVHLRSTKHYTTRAIDTAMLTARMLARQDVDFGRISPDQIRDMAAEIARETALNLREQSGFGLSFAFDWRRKPHKAETEIRRMGRMLDAQSPFRRYLALNYLKAAEVIFPTNPDLMRRISGHLNLLPGGGKDLYQPLRQTAQKIAQRFLPAACPARGAPRP